MLTWIDSHCHLNYPELSTDLPQTLRNATNANVRAMLTICTELDQFEDVYAIAQAHSNIWASIGIHPHEAQPATDKMKPDEVTQTLIDKARYPKVIAYGETGLDYYYEHSPRLEQQQMFRAHCDAAMAMNMPLIVHTRDAEDDTIQVLQSYNGKLRGVIHCFTGTAALAQAALDLGFYISISGVVTFKKSDALREIVASLPLERLLLETDAPYLAPEPYRGQANQPAYMIRTAETVAGLKKVCLEELSESSTKNFFALFNRASHDALN